MKQEQQSLDAHPNHPTTQQHSALQDGRLIRLQTALAWILLLAVCMFLPSLALAQTTQAWSDPAEARTAALEDPVPPDPKVLQGELDNGLRYYIRENSEPENRAQFRLVVDVGSIVEDEDQRGLAHFVEHMAFNGTENFDKQELVNALESMGMRFGAHLNASTSFDETVYSLQVPTDNQQHVRTAFQILEDWATNVTMEPEEIELERGVVIEEWRGRRGAGARVQDQQFPVLFQDSQYAERLPIGTLESLQNFEHQALRRFYRDWYRPELMTVVAVGSFDAREMEALLLQHFEDIPASSNPRERVRYEVPSHDTTRYAIATDPELPTNRVQVLHKLPGQAEWSHGTYRQSLVERLYNGMLNARFQVLLRQSDAPFLAASSGHARLIRTLDAYVLNAVVPEGGVEAGLEALFIEAERVGRHGFTSEELERQKTNMLRQVERDFTDRENRSSSSLVNEFVRASLTGEDIPGIEYEYELFRRFVPEITLEEVNSVGRQWIRDENRVVAVASVGDPSAAPAPEDLSAVIAAVEELDIDPYEESAPGEDLLDIEPEGTPVIASRSLEGGITEWDLENGVRVVLKPTDFREDQVLFHGFSPGGTSMASDDEFASASVAAPLIANGGLGSLDAIELRRELTGQAVSVSPAFTNYDESINGNASPSDLETMFRLIYLRFTAPRTDEALFGVMQNQARSAMQNRNANPAARFGDAFTRVFYQDHPRRQPPSLELLEQWDLEESLDFYRDRFADASDFTFIFVGNFDPEVMQPLVERYLGGLPSIARDETWRDVGVRPAAGVHREVVNAGQEPQSQTRIVFHGPADLSSPLERARIIVTSQLLQTRLRNVMREELGGTYNVSVGNSLTYLPEQRYAFGITFGSDPARADELAQTVFDEIASLSTEGPAGATLTTLKRIVARSYEANMRQNPFWLSQLLSSYRYSEDPGAGGLLAFPDTLAEVTPALVREGFEKYFDMDNYVHVTLMPENHEGQAANSIQ